MKYWNDLVWAMVSLMCGLGVVSKPLTPILEDGEMAPEDELKPVAIARGSKTDG